MQPDVRNHNVTDRDEERSEWEQDEDKEDYTAQNCGMDSFSMGDESDDSRAAGPRKKVETEKQWGCPREKSNYRPDSNGERG